MVGLLTPQGGSFATYGRMSLGGAEATPDTVFEIGSITKVFTALLLADMVERGEVKLDDPVRNFLPASVKVPSRGGKEITLVDLATQTSGVPRDSVKVDLDSATSAYADYSTSQLYAFVGSYRLDVIQARSTSIRMSASDSWGMRSRCELVSATRTCCSAGFSSRSA